MSKKIEKVSFLIHPGFAYQYATRDDLYEEEIEEEKVKEKKSKILLQKYVEHVRQMGEDELLFIFIDGKRDYFYKTSYRKNDDLAQAIKECRAILGRRAITIFDENRDVLSDPTRLYETVKKIAESRGFTFGKDVKTEAFGETLGACVETGAESFNKLGDFDEKTVIRAELTDGPLNLEEPFDSTSHKKRMLSRFKRISY